METVTGIGGVFFRATDPDLLTRWYQEHLGVEAPPASYEESSWRQHAGPTVFAALPSDSEHFQAADQQWAINVRVRDLDAMVAQLRSAGIDVSVHAETYPNGRFADLVDPEGTPSSSGSQRGRTRCSWHSETLPGHRHSRRTRSCPCPIHHPSTTATTAR